MTFLNMLTTESKKVNEHSEIVNHSQKNISPEQNLGETELKKPEEILRNSGYKIKLITPTIFGTQIDFAKKYDSEDLENLLSTFKIKIKGNSIFIID